MIQPTRWPAAQRDRKSTLPGNRQLKGHYAALIQRLGALRDGSGALPYALGITSCNRDEGVSTVAANVAISAAQDPAQNVLLIDAATVNPSVALAFEVEANFGFFKALRNVPAACQHVQTTSLQNLALLTAGPAHGEQTYSVDQQALAALIAELKQTFSLIVFDLPQAHELTPCFALAGALDGVLLVVEADRVDSELAQRTKRNLVGANANLVGVVLNKQS